MRAAIYARYSSDKQRAASIEDQVRECRAEIARRDWTEMVCLSDAEIPGTVAERRPRYQELLRGARAREFDVIVVDELSRLTRDPEHLARLRKLLAFRRVHLRTIADGIDTTLAPEAAAAVIAMRGYTNEAELRATAHRTRRGLRGAVLAGHHAGGLAYGYRTRAVHADREGDPSGTGDRKSVV